jgi:hypothetical protein
MSRVLLFIFAAILISSCEKAPGPGGKAKINVTVINGNSPVADAIVKIKYGATAYPGVNGKYDDDMIGDYSGHASFDNLTRGDYYIYASNPDTTMSTDWEGGAHVLINNKPGETHIVVDFSEEDPF